MGSSDAQHLGTVLLQEGSKPGNVDTTKPKPASNTNNLKGPDGREICRGYNRLVGKCEYGLKCNFFHIYQERPGKYPSSEHDIAAGQKTQ